MHFSVTRITTADPQRVYDVFTDLEQLPQHIEAIQRLEPVNEGEPLEIAEGRAFRETRLMFGKEATEVLTACDVREDGYALTCESCNTHYRFSYTFTPTADGGTSIEMRGDGEALTLGAKVMSLVFFPMRGVMIKHCTKDLETLIAAAEAPAT